MAYHVFLTKDHEQLVVVGEPMFKLTEKYGCLPIGNVMPTIRVALADEVRTWLDQNTVGEVKMVSALFVDGLHESQRGALYFADDAEAILFKMRWF